MIYRSFPDIYTFGHGVSTNKKTMSVMILCGYEHQNTSKIWCENFLTVYSDGQRGGLSLKSVVATGLYGIGRTSETKYRNLVKRNFFIV